MASLGFTGTREKPTQLQQNRLEEWIKEYGLHFTQFHHGDCIGADQFAHGEFYSLTRALIFIHPPIKSIYRANCGGTINRVVEMPAKDYLSRNQDIVDSSNMLLAMPKGKEEVRSGTWATVRMARRANLPIFIFWPNGKVDEEGREDDSKSNRTSRTP